MAITVQLNGDDEQVLREMAAREGVSPDHAARQAVLERAERIGLELAVHEAGVRAVERYAALLDRLSR